MLPLKSSDRHIVEKDGAEYGFKFLLGSMQAEYSAMMKETSKVLRELLRFQKKLKGIDEDDVDAVEKISQEIDGYNDLLIKQRIRLVDMFLDTIDGAEVPHPVAEVFRPGDIDKLAEMIQEEIGPISGNEVREIKNSSRPPSSDSTATDSSTGATGVTPEPENAADVSGR